MDLSKEKEQCLKAKQTIYVQTIVHTFMEHFSSSLQDPVLLISASRWAKQGAHMHAAQRATSYLVTYTEGSGSFDPYFVLSPKQELQQKLLGVNLSINSSISFLASYRHQPFPLCPYPSLSRKFFSNRLCICHCSVPQHYQETENVKRQ